jgi:hypothetical protein
MIFQLQAQPPWGGNRGIDGTMSLYNYSQSHVLGSDRYGLIDTWRDRPYRFVIVGDGANIARYQNGGAPTSKAYQYPVDLLPGTLQLAGDASEATCGDGGFAEIIVCNGAWTTEQLAAIDAYLVTQWGNLSPEVSIVERDLVTDFDGHFGAWNAWYRCMPTYPVKLTIPEGSFGDRDVGDHLADCGPYDGAYLQTKPYEATVEGAGSSLTTLEFAALFNGGLPSTGGMQPKIETALEGATSVTLKDAAQAVNFPVDQWVCITGIDMQGYGYPQNPYFHDWCQVTGVDLETGIINLDRPLRFTYKDTWPQFNTADIYSPDPGGPATIYPAKSFAQTVTLKGFTNVDPGSWFGNCIMDVTFIDCNFYGYEPAPSMSLSYLFQDCDCGGAIMEVDKVIRRLEFDNSHVRSLWIQSAGSTDEVVISNGSDIDSLTGGPRDLIIEDSNVDSLGIGPAYGGTRSVTITNSYIGDSVTAPVGIQCLGLPTSTTLPYSWDTGTGVISCNKRAFKSTNGLLRTIPGCWYFCRAKYPPGGASTKNMVAPYFQITDMWDDSDTQPDPVHQTLFIQTTLTGSQIPLPADLQGINLHICPSWTCTGVTGHFTLKGMNNAPPGIPFGEYTYLEYPDAEQVIDTVTNYGYEHYHQPNYRPMGKFVSLTVNVTTPYTGVKATAQLRPLGWVNGTELTPENFDGPTVLWKPIINLKVAGERIVTTTTVTGAQTGDTLTAPGPMWVGNAATDSDWTIMADEDPSVRAAFTVEIVLDQGISSNGSPGSP